MRTSSDLQTIRVIQKEYVRHVRSFYGPVIDEFLASGAEWQEFSTDLFGSVLKSEGVLRFYAGTYWPREAERLLRFLAANRAFWLQHSDPLAEALENAGLFALGGARHLAARGVAAKQLLYFDSLLLPDPNFHGDEVDLLRNNPVETITPAVSQVLIVGMFEAAMSADTDFPLVIFYPEHFCRDDPSHPKRLPNYDEAMEASFRYAEKVFGVAGSRERFRLGDWGDNARVPVRVDRSQMDRLIPGLLKTASTDLVMQAQAFPKHLYKHLLKGSISGTELRYLLTLIATEQSLVSIGEANANRFTFDFSYGDHNYFLSEIGSKHTREEWLRHVPLQESELASYAFTTNFKWLDLSLLDAVRLREEDVSGESRTVLRASRSVLKAATLEGFPEAAKAFESEVREHTMRATEDAKRIIAKESNRFRLSILSLAGSVVLAVASVAFPPLAPAALISSIVTLAVGGSSVRDVVNAHLSGKRKRAELFQRPLAFLAKSLEKSSNQRGTS